MTSTPPAAQAPTKVEKPSLTGAKIKQRKGVAKSQSKFEPEAFRDQLYKFFEGVAAPDDFDGYAAALDKAGNTLDYRKYADPLFEILIAGGLLAPGGSYLDDAALSPFSIFGAKGATPAEVRPYVTVMDKVIRRYKFLQKGLEESTLRNILQYVNRFEPAQKDKLAVATALMVQQGIVSANVLSVLQKDHLTKDDLAIHFIDLIFKSYLADSSMDHLGSSLRKGGIREPILFFPPNKRSTPGLVVSHFRSAGLAPVAEYFQKRAAKEAKDGVVSRLREMRDELFEAHGAAASAASAAAPAPSAADTAGEGAEKKAESDAAAPDPAAAAAKAEAEARRSNAAEAQASLKRITDEIIEMLQEQREARGLTQEDFIPIVWDGLMKELDLSSRADQVEGQALRAVKRIAPILERFSSTPKAEIALINTMQLHCYEEQVMMKAFPGFLRILYNDDVVSDSAILFWAQKGSKPQGREVFLQLTAPLIKFLEEQSDEEEDDE